MDVDSLRTLVTGAHRLGPWQAAGVPAHQLASGLGRSAHHGRWAFAAAGTREDARQRALEDASVLPPDGAVGGWGAAHLLGVEWLDGTDAAGGRQAGVVCLPPHRQVRRPGLRALRSRLDPGDVVLVAGTRVTSPVRTAFDLARTASDLATAVERLDCLLAYGVAAGDVAEYARRRPRWAGVQRVRQAVSLASGRIRSPAESRWRLVWQLGAGLSRPMVNATVVDLDGWVHAEVDPMDPVIGLVGEYDGSPHSGAAQRSKDARRQERLERLGLTVVRCTAVDLGRPHVLVARVRDAAGRAGGVPGPRRWAARELAVSVGHLRAYEVVGPSGLSPGCAQTDGHAGVSVSS